MIGIFPSIVAFSRMFGRKSLHWNSGLVWVGSSMRGLRSVYHPEVKNCLPSWP